MSRLMGHRVQPTTAYGVAGCALIVAYFAAPDGSDIAHLFYELVALSSLAAVCVGLRLHRVNNDIAWWLIGRCIASWSDGAVTY